MNKLAEENQTLEEIVKELDQWKRTFPNQTPQQVKDKVEDYKVKSIEELMASRNSRNNFKKKSIKYVKFALKWNMIILNILEFQIRGSFFIMFIVFVLFAKKQFN